MMKVTLLLLVFSFLCFESARCDAGHAGFQPIPQPQPISLSQHLPLSQPIPFPQPFPVDSSIAFQVESPFPFQVSQPNVLSIAPNFCNVKGSVPVGNKCLLIERTPLSWEESNRYCSQIGFKLLEILGGEEYFQLISFLRANGLLTNSYWVGAAKKFNNFWTWVSQGSPIHSTFWAVTFLNGKGVKEPISQYHSSDCGVLSKSRSHFLKAEQCLSRNSFICEKSFRPAPQFPPTHSNPWAVNPYFLEGEDETLPTCPEGFTYSSSQDKCYAVNTGSLVSFSDAQTKCEDMDGHLVAINSTEENHALRDLSTNDSGHVHIGLFSDASGEFEWVSGQPVMFTYWGPGEPATETMSCGSFNLETGKWKDNSCQDMQGYICEAPAL